jgi:hypothetical protein
MNEQRVWFNQGFSIRNALALVRRDAPASLTLLASNDRLGAPALTAADELFEEPRLDGPGDEPARYLAWCLETCAARHIDLFVPGRHRLHLAHHAQDFARNGTKLSLATDPDTLEAIEDKLTFTVRAKEHALPVPETFHVRSEREFGNAVRELRGRGHDVCVKPRRGVFGAGYWKLSDEKPLFDRLMNPDARAIPTEIVAAAFADKPGAELLVLEYLPGVETSTDCLCHRGRLLTGVARRKESGAQRLTASGPALELAARAIAAFDLSGLVNVQMIEDRDGAPKLLEINPRMSGGCLYTTFLGINLPWWYVALELGLAAPDDVPTPSEGEVLVAALPDAIRLDRSKATFSDFVRGPCQ